MADRSCDRPCLAAHGRIAWASVYLNVAAARGDPVCSVMHAAMPTLFIVATEGRVRGCPDFAVASSSPS